MPFIPALNTARVSVIQTWHNQQVQNVYHVQRGGAWDLAALNTLAEVFIDWMNEDLAPILSTDIQFQSIIARDLTTEEAAGVEVAFPPLSGGDVAVGGSVPGNVTVAVKHVTGLTGRSRRGRSFLAGMPNGALVGNTINEGLQDAIQAAFTELLGDVTAAGFEWVVASFYHGTNPDGSPTPRATAVMTPVTSVTVDPNLDSQRRRLNGRGI
jgi:hypothetical protein